MMDRFLVPAWGSDLEDEKAVATTGTLGVPNDIKRSLPVENRRIRLTHGNVTRTHRRRREVVGPHAATATGGSGPLQYGCRRRCLRHTSMTGQQVMSREATSGYRERRRRHRTHAGLVAQLVEATNRPAGAPLERLQGHCGRPGNGGSGRRGGAGLSDGTAL